MRIRPFRPEDATAVHRWFNNREAISSLMEVRDAFSEENARGLDRGRRRRRRGGPQVGDRGRGPRRAGRLHRPLRPLPADGPRARRADRRPARRPRGRARGRAPDGRQGLRGVRRPPRLRPDPGLQLGREEGRLLAGLAARGNDGRAHPPPRRHPDRLRGLGDHAGRLAGALGGPIGSARADRRSRRGGRRGGVLPLAPVPRGGGDDAHAPARRRGLARRRPAGGARDPGSRSPRRDLALLLPGREGERAADRSRKRRPGRGGAGQRLRPRPPRRAARARGRQRAIGRPRLRSVAGAQVADERSPADPQERGRRLLLAGRRRPRVLRGGPGPIPRRLHRDDARRRRRRPLLLRARLLPHPAHLPAELAGRGRRARRRGGCLGARGAQRRLPALLPLGDRRRAPQRGAVEEPDRRRDRSRRGDGAAAEPRRRGQARGRARGVQARASPTASFPTGPTS